MSFLTLVALAALAPPADRLVFDGPGKRIVFLAGDEEYRSEEGLPLLAHILSKKHGFRCTVLFSQNEKGEIDPDEHHRQPGMEALDTADLCVMLLRFREWPDDQMRHFVDYYLAGKPIMALRTSTHAFDYAPASQSPYKRFGWRSADWPGGFGRQVLGENWVTHWGDHGHQATRGAIEEGAKDHPILRGVHDVFGTTDVYEAAPPADAEILLRGEVLSGMNPTDAKAAGQKATVQGRTQDLNDPMMPIVWIRQPRNEAGKTNRIFTTTMGAATDLLSEDFRRLIVNGVYWSLGMEKKTPRRANVDIPRSYQPSKFGFDGFRRGVKPAETFVERNGVR